MSMMGLRLRGRMVKLTGGDEGSWRPLALKMVLR